MASSVAELSLHLFTLPPLFADELAHKAGVDSLKFFRDIYDNNKDPEQAEKVLRD